MDNSLRYKFENHADTFDADGNLKFRIGFEPYGNPMAVLDAILYGAAYHFRSKYEDLVALMETSDENGQYWTIYDEQTPIGKIVFAYAKD